MNEQNGDRGAQAAKDEAIAEALFKADCDRIRAAEQLEQSAFALMAAEREIHALRRTESLLWVALPTALAVGIAIGVFWGSP